MINSTTFAAAIDKKVVFYTIDTQLMVGYFETGHNEDINDMAYLETTAGDKVIVTGSFDDKCRGIFKLYFLNLSYSIALQCSNGPEQLGYILLILLLTRKILMQ